MKLKRLDNDIKKKNPAHIMKLKENQKKMPHRGIEPDKQKLGVHGAEQFNADTTRQQCRRYQKCYYLYSTSEPDKLVATKQQREIL